MSELTTYTGIVEDRVALDELTAEGANLSPEDIEYLAGVQTELDIAKDGLKNEVRRRIMTPEGTIEDAATLQGGIKQGTYTPGGAYSNGRRA